MHIKNLFLIILIFSFFSCLTSKEAEKKTEPVLIKENILLFSEDPGLYIYYLDLRKSDEKKLTGLLYTGQNKFLIRTYDFLSKKETKTLLEVILINGEYSIDILESQVDAGYENIFKLKEYLSECINIFFDIRSDLSEKKELIKETSLSKNEYEISYKSWIPFFSLFAIRDKNDKKPFFELVKTGMINKKDDPDFFNYTEILESSEGFEYKIMPKKKTSIVLNNTRINLDDNWVRNENKNINGQINETFSIMKNVVKYADIEIRIESLSKMKINDINELIKLRLYSEKNNRILPESVKITDTQSLTILNYELINDFYKAKYIINSIFIKNNDEVKIINFLTYKKVYSMNKDYFDRILSELVKINNFL